LVKAVRDFSPERLTKSPDSRTASTGEARRTSLVPYTLVVRAEWSTAAVSPVNEINPEARPRREFIPKREV